MNSPQTDKCVGQAIKLFSSMQRTMLVEFECLIRTGILSPEDAQNEIISTKNAMAGIAGLIGDSDEQ